MNVVMQYRRVLLLLALYLVPATARAAVDTGDSTAHLSATAELAYSDASGNTSIAQLSSRLGGKRISRGSELSFVAGLRYGKQDGDVAAESYLTEVNARFRPRSWVSPFFYARGSRDLITKIDLRVSAAAGVDLNLVPQDNQRVSLGLAVLQDYERRILPLDSEDPHIIRSTRVNLRLVANPTIRKGIKAEHTTQFEPVASDFSNYLFSSRTSLRILLTGGLAFQTSYQFSYDATPAPGVAYKTDRTLTTGLIVELK